MTTRRFVFENWFTLNPLKKHLLLLVLFCISTVSLFAQTRNSFLKVKETVVAEGWANNSINVVIFRKNSLVTHNDTQYIAFYDQQKQLVLGKRKVGSDKWTVKQTPYTGNVLDAHNTVSLIVDGSGYLHVSWDHHNNALRYCRSVKPGSLELTDKMPMTGIAEESVSYPEFYRLADGDLIFFYRDGGSGRGNLVINKYQTSTKKWTQLHNNLINGEGQRNAYWQACTDKKGNIHLSWVWRETPDVASNHDLCYAVSRDGGLTWEKSNGEKYTLPITASTAEYALKIPQKSELINQTSMSADNNGNPYIASYWRKADSDIPQYHVVYLEGNQWRVQDLEFRKTPFTLSGAGTKRIPISRPQIIVKAHEKSVSAFLIFRDEERRNKVSVAMSNDINNGNWKVVDLTSDDVGSWEPTYDTELWKNKGILDLFVQKVIQIDGEGQADITPQPVKVLEWMPGKIVINTK